MIFFDVSRAGQSKPSPQSIYGILRQGLPSTATALERI